VKSLEVSRRLWRLTVRLLPLGTIVALSTAFAQIPAPCTIETIAGGGIAYSGDSGSASDAEFQYVADILFDDEGNLFIADFGNHTVRKVDTGGIITTIAGVGTPGFSGDGGPATSAELDEPRAIALDPTGNLYIFDSDNARIRKVDTNGVITTIAGNGTYGFSGDGGPAVEAQFGTEGRITVGPDGALYLVDKWNHRVRRIEIGGSIRTVVGTGPTTSRTGSREIFAGDGGPSEDAFLSAPRDLAFDIEGRLLIADTENQRIRRVALDGTILTIAGRGYNSWDWPIAGQSALSVSVGKVLRVLPQASGETFFTSSGIGGIWAVGSDGLIQRENTTGLRGMTRIDTTDGGRLFGHLTGAEVSELQPDASLIRFAGEARTGLWGDGGPATDAFIWRVQDVAADSIGNLYVPEDIMHKVRVVSPTGTISTFAGTSGLSQR